VRLSEGRSQRRAHEALPPFQAPRLHPLSHSGLCAPPLSRLPFAPLLFISSDENSLLGISPFPNARGLHGHAIDVGFLMEPTKNHSRVIFGPLVSASSSKRPERTHPFSLEMLASGTPLSSSCP
jgi:hypothetical protein